VKESLPVEVRLYDYLLKADADNQKDFITALNPNSLTVLSECRIEPSVAWVSQGTKYQFLREGYFCVDKDSRKEHLVFNRVVGLRDSWAKAKRK
jgi:glutaminyl-tRNA synthetase